MAIQIGFVLFTYLTVRVWSQQTTQCYYYIQSPNPGSQGYSSKKDCFYGCCNQANPNTYEPCCATPVAYDGLGPGAIGGIVIGVIVALIICGAGVFFFIRFNKKKEGGEKYMTPAKPAVSYITTSEITDVTDLSRLPPLASHDDDREFSHDATSYRSYKSDSYSQQSESKYPRPNHLSLNSQKPANSISSLDSREHPPRSGSRQHNRNFAPSVSSVESREDPPRQRSPGHQHQRGRTASNSSTGSRDRHQRPTRPGHQTRNHAQSVSSVTSNTDSIGTTV